MKLLLEYQLRDVREAVKEYNHSFVGNHGEDKWTTEALVERILEIIDSGVKISLDKQL